MNRNAERVGEKVPVVLTIAGTDPSGGAGVYADLQVFRDHHCYGVAVVTAVVWQNTQGVDGWRAMEGSELRAQLESLRSDVDIDAVKIGMLPTAELVGQVQRFLNCLDDDVSVVLDPVMASGNGEAELMDGSGRAALFKLVDSVDLITPNGPEAQALTGLEISEVEPDQVAQRLIDTGWKRVLLKGGHLREAPVAEVVDWYGDGDGVCKLSKVVALPYDVRGTGCQLSSAIAAERARGKDWHEAVRAGRHYLQRVLRRYIRRIGEGRPVVARIGPDDE